MCSLAGDVMLEETISLGSTNKLLNAKCKKCDNSNVSVVLRSKDVYCKSCFIAATVHKFRVVLGKYRIMRPNEKVLVVYKPGHPSTALLHLLRSGLDQPEHKKLKFEPVILYIDEFSKLPVQKRLEICHDAAKEIESIKFAGYVTLLQNFIANFDQPPSCVELNCKVNKNIFQPSPISYADLTQSEDVMSISRRQLIIRTAKQLNCKAVLAPEICFDVAVGILSDISLGRGAHVSLNEGILDDRDREVKILQPLRYFDIKEIAFYNVYNGIEPVNIGNPTEKVNSTSSVQNLMKKFVSNLQENFPATMTTVVRTGDKLTCKKTLHVCAFCKAPIEQLQELSSAEATEFSHQISTNPESKCSVSEAQPRTNSKFCFACSKIVSIVGEKHFVT